MARSKPSGGYPYERHSPPQPGVDDYWRLPGPRLSILDRKWTFLPAILGSPAGGFQSIDGMHPSGCGYARLASEAMRLLNLDQDTPNLLQRGFAEDSLLSHYPIELRAVTSLLQMTRDLIRVNGFVHTRQTFLGEGLRAADVLRMMQSVFAS